MHQNLYQRIGGEVTVRAVVVKLYEKILSDEYLAPFFENSDVEKLRLSQIAFVTYAFGGMGHYTGKNLRQVHAHAVTQGLTDLHFDLVKGYLKEAMEELKVAPLLIKEALAIVESTRSDILNR